MTYDQIQDLTKKYEAALRVKAGCVHPGAEGDYSYENAYLVGYLLQTLASIAEKDREVLDNMIAVALGLK